MNCPNCNATIADGTRFCPSCGTPIVATQQAAPYAPARPAAQVAQLRDRVDAFVRSDAMAANMPWVFIGIDALLIIALALLPWVGYGGFIAVSLPRAVSMCLQGASQISYFGGNAFQFVLMGIAIAAVLVVDLGLAGLRLYEAFGGRIPNVNSVVTQLASRGYLVTLVSTIALLVVWATIFISNGGTQAMSYATGSIQIGAWLTLLASGVGLYLQRTAK